MSVSYNKSYVNYQVKKGPVFEENDASLKSYKTYSVISITYGITFLGYRNVKSISKAVKQPAAPISAPSSVYYRDEASSQSSLSQSEKHLITEYLSHHPLAKRAKE